MVVHILLFIGFLALVRATLMALRGMGSSISDQPNDEGERI